VKTLTLIIPWDTYLLTLKNYKHKNARTEKLRKTLAYKKVSSKMLMKSTPVCSQFHQHFISSFCANILLPKKLQSQTVIREKL